MFEKSLILLKASSVYQRINAQTEEINQLLVFFREKSDLSEAVEALRCERQAIDEYHKKQSQVCHN